MPTLAEFPPKTATPKQERSIRQSAHSNGAAEPNSNLCQFKPKEVDMMPAQWAQPGCPTPYELRVTIETCKRLWKMNKQALENVECDREQTEYNIKVLERLYMHLMDYLIES